MPSNIISRFLYSFILGSDDECWNWLRARNQKGYGRINFNNKIYPAHRFSYEHYKGKIPDGLFVLHSCDNPSCVNPAHLRIGTLGDNIRECVNKNRHPVAKKGIQPKGFGFIGEKHPRSKINDLIVLEIKKRLRDNVSIKDIKKEFSVGDGVVYKIRNNSRWRHINCP